MAPSDWETYPWKVCLVFHHQQKTKSHDLGCKISCIMRPWLFKDLKLHSRLIFVCYPGRYGMIKNISQFPGDWTPLKDHYVFVVECKDAILTCPRNTSWKTIKHTVCKYYLCMPLLSPQRWRFPVFTLQLPYAQPPLVSVKGCWMIHKFMNELAVRSTSFFSFSLDYNILHHLSHPRHRTQGENIIESLDHELHSFSIIFYCVSLLP